MSSSQMILNIYMLQNSNLYSSMTLIMSLQTLIINQYTPNLLITYIV